MLMLYVLYYVLHIAVVKNVLFIHERLHSYSHIFIEYIEYQCVMCSFSINPPY